MAEVGTWASIRQHGLLSTSEIVRRAGLSRSRAALLRSTHRPQKMTVTVPGLGSIVLRDQKPMEQRRLAAALNDGTTPQQWYELINDRVFF